MRLHGLYSTTIPPWLKIMGIIARKKLDIQESRMRSKVLLLVITTSLCKGFRMAMLLSMVSRKMVLIDTRVQPANTGPTR
ncbi:hypothetical protein FKM82_019198 [Ascaphus truei]